MFAHEHLPAAARSVQTPTRFTPLNTSLRKGNRVLRDESMLLRAHIPQFRRNIQLPTCGRTKFAWNVVEQGQSALLARSLCLRLQRRPEASGPGTQAMLVSGRWAGRCCMGIQQHEMPSSKHNNAVSARLICELQISRLQLLVQVHFRRALAGVTLSRTAEQHSSVIVRLRMLQEIHDQNDIINGEQPALLRTWF